MFLFTQRNYFTLKNVLFADLYNGEGEKYPSLWGKKVSGTCCVVSRTAAINGKSDGPFKCCQLYCFKSVCGYLLPPSGWWRNNMQVSSIMLTRRTLVDHYVRYSFIIGALNLLHESHSGYCDAERWYQSFRGSRAGSLALILTRIYVFNCDWNGFRCLNMTQSCWDKPDVHSFEWNWQLKQSKYAFLLLFISVASWFTCKEDSDSK